MVMAVTVLEKIGFCEGGLDMTQQDKNEIVQALARCFQEASLVFEKLLEQACIESGLRRTQHSPETDGRSAPLLTVEEAARFLSVTPRTVYAYVQKEKLPTRRVGSEIRFCRQELDAWTKQVEDRPRRGQ
jgi:excisionase family DNA binding protein